MGKWCWRLREEHGRLWHEVLLSSYGEEDGRICDGDRVEYVWWKNLATNIEEVGLGVSNWFNENLGRSVGDGFSTLFWWELWLKGIALKVTFRRLFELDEHKMTSMADMCPLGWGEDGEAWKWGWHLLAWEEEEVRKLSALLNNVVLQASVRRRVDMAFTSI